MRASRLSAMFLLAASAGAAVAAGAHARGRPITVSAPVVQTMIVGRGGQPLFGERSVPAAATTVPVHGRSCSVASATPLAVLAGARREGGPAFVLRDYGSCGSSAQSSSELYVVSVGGEAAAAASGWEYKVNGTAGSTGAGDPSGPRGNGRRPSGGAQVLWFWCEHSSSGCQHTLELSAPTLVSPGQSVPVSVTGADDEGQRFAVARVDIVLAGVSASSGASGRARLRAPAAPGRYRLTASRAGLVPAFPVTVTVR